MNFVSLVLTLFAVTSSWVEPAHAGLFDFIENCSDRLLGLNPEPSRSDLRRRREVRTDLLARHLVELIEERRAEVEARRTARSERYGKAKRAFLDTFTEPARRELAVESFGGFKRDSSDASDLAQAQRLLTLVYPHIHGDQFRRLGQALLARANFFDSAVDVNRMIELIATAAGHRELSSAEISILQVTMIKEFAEYAKGESAAEGLRFVLGEWALGIEQGDLAVVFTTADDAFRKFDSSAHRPAGQIADTFLRHWSTRQGTN